MKTFFHRSDLDGHCSGAIIKNEFPACKMIGIEYGDEFPWEIIEDPETVFMVDFSIQPIEEMKRFSNEWFVWIDHHKSAIEEARKINLDPMGLREIGKGACELTWEYLYQKKAPLAIQLLSRYDVWDHKNPWTLPFQYGMRIRKTNPEDPEAMKLWQVLFNDKDGYEIEDIVQEGEVILQYEKIQNEKYIERFAFEVNWEGLNWIAVNKGLSNSKIFDSVYDINIYDGMLTFCFLEKGWTVSLYSTKESVDVSEIAKKYGGGGHAQAAGFQSQTLSFI